MLENTQIKKISSKIHWTNFTRAETGKFISGEKKKNLTELFLRHC